MHQGNREWLTYAQLTYGHLWRFGGILELGSFDYNGSARLYLSSDLYVGVDRTAGPGVDLVCDANQTGFFQLFSCIVCTSMLEHDPNWRDSLDHNMKWLKPGGTLLLSWGAEGNQHHEPEPWAFVPVGDVLEWAMARGFLILEAHWERNRFAGDATGCYDMIIRSPLLGS